MGNQRNKLENGEDREWTKDLKGTGENVCYKGKDLSGVWNECNILVGPTI